MKEDFQMEKYAFNNVYHKGSEKEEEEKCEKNILTKVFTSNVVNRL